MGIRKTKEMNRACWENKHGELSHGQNLLWRPLSCQNTVKASISLNLALKLVILEAEKVF